MKQPTPQQIRDRAYHARISIHRLMKRAGVDNSTFCRWANGSTANIHPITLGKIVDALESVERERVA